jgi:hypothetical protein
MLENTGYLVIYFWDWLHWVCKADGYAWSGFLDPSALHGQMSKGEATTSSRDSIMAAVNWVGCGQIWFDATLPQLLPEQRIGWCDSDDKLDIFGEYGLLLDSAMQGLMGSRYQWRTSHKPSVMMVLGKLGQTRAEVHGNWLDGRSEF